ncbi:MULTISPECIES: winged helix DNA-binding domain-containing protein [unclassified Knoellia]|uniref:winged helix DNA-binding domain-containing protein n=1 Tax=Knoellia altitudinis TaxID=3404795 RepID=UPI0036218F67
MPRHVTRDWVIRRRLAVQRLSSAPLPQAADAVRLLTCVQSQDAPLAAHSLAMRSRAITYAAVLAEQSAGGWVRTHILRPTWHHVAPEDLRWIQALTGGKVEAAMPARHRQLGLTPEIVDRGIDLLRELLRGGRTMTRKEIGPEFAAAGLPGPGETMAHQLICAEVRAVICSGPPRGTEHTYALVDETIPAAEADTWSRERALVELTHRFHAGHGPASERDLQRWSGLTLTEIRSATAEIMTSSSLQSTHPLESVECQGETLWYDPTVTARTSLKHTAYLLSTFDEAALTYPTTGFPRSNPDTDRTRLISEAAGGIVVVDGHDLGTFKRKTEPRRVTVTVRLEADLDPAERDGIAEAAQFLAAFHDLPLNLVFA